MNARGQVTEEELGIGSSGIPAVTAAYSFEADNGQMSGIEAVNAAGATVQFTVTVMVDASTVGIITNTVDMTWVDTLAPANMAQAMETAGHVAPYAAPTFDFTQALKTTEETEQGAATIDRPTTTFQRTLQSSCDHQMKWSTQLGSRIACCR